MGNQLPEEDASQDWVLHWASESDTHTYLSFSRDFDTCDAQDYPITENKISLIWAYGERDRIDYHLRNRGVYQVYLLHPDYTPGIVQDTNVGNRNTSLINSVKSSKNLKVWTLSSQMIAPSEDTAYWCTIHKGPSLPRKHHLVGFEVRFPNEQSRRHVHHLTVFRCYPPSGVSANRMFANYLGNRGQLCFSVKDPLGPLPTEYCTQHFQVWAVGGRPFFYPPYIGSPMGEVKDEYYLLQVHYDNPNRVENVQVGLSIDYYYTSTLRSEEAGIMMYRHEAPGITPSILIPPSTMHQTVYGLCGGECTERMLPPEGIRIYGVLLHSHNSGVAIKFHHFRGNQELPWIEKDDNYGFDYQQVRVLNKEVKILPGDLLAVRCSYDNTRLNTSVVGGWSSQQEMCAVFFYYYNRIDDYVQCSSEIDSAEARKKFLGIGNVTWSNREVEFMVEEGPEKVRGLKLSQVADDYVEWSLDKREELQKFQLEHLQINRCPQELYAGRFETDDEEYFVGYPLDVEPYVPPKSCSFQ